MKRFSGGWSALAAIVCISALLVSCGGGGGGEGNTTITGTVSGTEVVAFDMS